MKHPLLLDEIQNFLTKFCQSERRLSRQTVLSYRDALKLFVLYLRDKKQDKLSTTGLDVLSYELLSDFLQYLEIERRVSISTRNQRLCAIKSFCGYVLFRHPQYAGTLSRCLLLARKRREKINRTFLSQQESDAVLRSIDQGHWTGCRNHLMISTAILTGLRVSELVDLKRGDVTIGKFSHITVLGKGRKTRSIPINKILAKRIEQWGRDSEISASHNLFPTSRGSRLSVDAFQVALKKYVAIASQNTKSLLGKNISPHTLRHTTAMHLLERGVDVQIIALWLGHEQVNTTQIYLSESLAIKRRALRRTKLKVEWSAPKIQRSEISFLDDL